MSDRVFFDSNILIYAYSIDEPKKRQLVINLLNQYGKIIISTQTINEFIQVTTRKKMLSFQDVDKIVSELYYFFIVEAISQPIIHKAITLARKHNYSYFDSLILASALASNCAILYSEDMHNQHLIESTLRIVNPFSN
ncbi:MAG TPA: PIN domain-containing protein [Candidatus Babeliaceae bacterium]|nr:PIN domain-containing protein [Candidatus Babeliaceae bacterium]